MVAIVDIDCFNCGPSASGNTEEINFNVPSGSNIVSIQWNFAWMETLAIDTDKLLEEFRFRIQSYRKALFKHKPIKSIQHYRQKITNRFTPQRQNFRGKMVTE